MNDNYSLYIDYSRQKAWSGAPMWLEMSLGAMGGGMFIVSSVLGITAGLLLGYVLLTAGKGICLLADLGKPQRFLRVLAKPFTSWISFGSWVFMVFGITGIIYCASCVSGVARGSEVMTCVKVLSVVCALVLITYDGFVLAASKGIAAWNCALLPILYGISSLAAGTGVAMLLRGMPANRSLLKVNGILLIALAFLLFSYVSVLRKSLLGARKSAMVLMTDLKREFIGGVVVVGIVIPVVLVAASIFGPPALLAIGFSGACEVLGVFFLRYAILRAGIYAPLA